MDPLAALNTEPPVTVPDSINLAVTNQSANQIRVTLDGSATIRLLELDPDSHPKTILTLDVFPDSTSTTPIAQGSYTFDLAGNVTYSGIFDASHFIVDVTSDSVKVTARNDAPFIISVPDTGLATPQLKLDDEHEFQLGPPQVPALNGVGLGALAILMSLAGFITLRRVSKAT